ncbi:MULTISPECIES: class I SAM-dependent methyltransferase [Rhodomicrobium]|uniref:class I SAM-dependent methyltransferase n=1 Tax=Rhodomicrobium TaxID=1068 RepID=UPI000B4ADCB1|nr:MULTISPECIES: class I SAM-dependent methyltransferase [Rhodomicrobium]
MIIAFADRHALIEFIGPGAVSTMVELGVFEGAFSDHCRRVLNPGRLTLIDHWDYAKYDFVLETAPQSRHIRSIFKDYFGGNPDKSLQAAYAKVMERFRGDPSVQVLRLDIAEAASRFADASLDVIYLDGSHTYEYVLRDLNLWFPKLSPGGLFICNDFCESQTASLQNIGVIPAVLTFAKRNKIYPIVLSASEWSDFYFSNRPSSPLIDRLGAGLLASGANTVEIPVELLGSYHHNVVQPSMRWIPSFRAKDIALTG